MTNNAMSEGESQAAPSVPKSHLVMSKVEEKSSTTFTTFSFSFSLSPGFLSFLREKFSPFLYGKLKKKGAKYFSLSLSPGFLSFLREKFSLYSSTLVMRVSHHLGNTQISQR
jgi:hypothetical protein